MKQIAVHQGTKNLVTWVQDDARVKPSVRVELKGEPGLWTVDAVYSRVDVGMVNRGWNVGGLAVKH
jgi:hypothetical protein